jgi:predicted aldo/keto reductase-like oxidoreductase
MVDLNSRLELPRSGLQVSRCCLGIVSRPEIVLAAFDAGVNFFFVTADMHWPLYEPQREGLRRLLARGPELRQRLVVAVVSYMTQPEFCEDGFYEVLDAIPGLDHVDLGVIGGSYSSDFLARLGVYERLRPAGMRGIGATFHQRSTAVTAVAHELLDVAFIRYNAAHAGAERDVFPLLPAKPRVPLFNFKSVAGYVPPARLEALGVSADHWRPSPADHYRFALRRREIDGVLCGFDEPEHVAEFGRALSDPPLSDDAAEYLKTLAALDAGAVELTDSALETRADPLLGTPAGT